MATRSNRMYLTGSIRDRNVRNRKNPEGFSPDDDNCSDSGAETFTGSPTDGEDALIHRVDSSRKAPAIPSLIERQMSWTSPKTLKKIARLIASREERRLATKPEKPIVKPVSTPAAFLPPVETQRSYCSKGRLVVTIGGKTLCSYPLPPMAGAPKDTTPITGTPVLVKAKAPKPIVAPAPKAIAAPAPKPAPKPVPVVVAPKPVARVLSPAEAKARFMARPTRSLAGYRR